ncbi:hypothetical protein GPA27_13405 [Aromatoleum toluolicum]|uniref:Uncharacterized protein n=1 Tax=Aromatoleum toluolicum TaxID=90060 RepID=A0ABX1NGE5_9RHOO|nr:hypothetical protein [Aromatoleum toluolicum]NMF98382.1 hypothetical protein [Aromatoleum toluolicum]
MGNRLFTNNARSTLASGISDVATTLSVATGEGALFASPSGGDWQDITLDDGVNIEIVHLTARSGDTLTVTRAQEGTTGVAFSTGAKVEARFTAGAASDLQPKAGQPYVMGTTYNGKPAASVLLLRHVIPTGITVTLAAAMAGSQGKAGTAATAQTDFDVQKNGASVGTIRFAAAGTVPTFIMASQTSLAAGDSIDIVAPGTQDATLADIGLTIFGTR